MFTFVTRFLTGCTLVALMCNACTDVMYAPKHEHIPERTIESSHVDGNEPTTKEAYPERMSEKIPVDTYPDAPDNKKDARSCTPTMDFVYTHEQFRRKEKMTYERYLSDYVVMGDSILLSIHDLRTYPSGRREVYAKSSLVGMDQRVRFSYSYIEDERIGSVSKVNLLIANANSYVEFISVFNATSPIQRSLRDGAFEGNYWTSTKLDHAPHIRPAFDKKRERFFGYSNASTVTCYGLDQKEGKPIWSYALSSKSVCSPALDSDGNIYTCSSDGHVYSISPTGSLNWKKKLAFPYINKAYLSVGRDDIYLVIEHKIVSLSKKSGMNNWMFSRDRIGLGVTISPSGLIWFGTSLGVAVINKSGKLVKNIVRSVGNALPPTILKDESVLAYHLNGITHLDPSGRILKQYDIKRKYILWSNEKTYVPGGDIFLRYKTAEDNEEGIMRIRGFCIEDVAEKGWPMADGGRFHQRAYR